MTDFHTHILPCMDDGSGSAGESAAMLREERNQGIRNVVLTPHFHARDDSIPSFLCRRQQAWNHLLPHLPPQCPNLFLGAEVGYFEGIGAAEGIRQLRVEGSSLLLLEMPFCRWTERMAEDVLKLNGREGIQVVLAHVGTLPCSRSKCGHIFGAMEFSCRRMCRSSRTGGASTGVCG